MERIDLLLKLATQAGKLLVDDSLKIEGFKGKNNIVTKGDYASESFIINEIAKHFPQDKVLAEESASSFDPRTTHEYVWVIDPIDGTRNYKRSRPYFSISIALTKDLETKAGIVHAPILGDTYFAIKTKGAFLNDARIYCSNISDISNASLCTDNASDPSITHENYALLLKPKDARLLFATGSSAITISELSAGKLDLYLHTYIQPWDQAAALLIAEESGALVTDFKGNSANFMSQQILVANAELSKKFLSLIL